MRWIWLATVLIGLAACGRSAPTATTAPATTAPATQTTTQSAQTPRVVSTVPAATLNLILMGGVDSLVGVSKYDVLLLPEAKHDLPVVGDYETMNYERLLGLKPTAVIVQFAASRVPAKLKELAEDKHFEIVNVKFDAIADVWETAGTLGRISGRKDQAEAAVRRAQKELKDIAAEYEGRKPPRVVYMIGRNSMMVVGGQTIVDEMITAAGGQNAAAEAGRGWPMISGETLVKLAPDVLLVGDPEGAPQQLDDPRVEPLKRYAIPAVRDHRVFLVTEGDSQMPSLDIPRHVRVLARLIHRAGEGAGGGGAEEPATKGATP